MAEFFIADLHFGDPTVISAKRGQRPFRDHAHMIEVIVSEWNALVSEEDTVWVLGDVAKKGWENKLSLLKGQKKLVGGNNDGDIQRLAGTGLFTEIHAVKYLPGMLLTHVPVHPSQVSPRTTNIHGHLHGGHIKDDRYLCVSVDQTGFRPISRTKVEWLLQRSHFERYPIPAPGKAHTVAA